MDSAAAEWGELQARLDLARDALDDLHDQITSTGQVIEHGHTFPCLANMRTTVTVAAGLLDEVALSAAAADPDTPAPFRPAGKRGRT